MATERVLLVILQPVLALARRRGDLYRMRLAVESGDEIELAIEAADFAAAARAIRKIERGADRVLRLERESRSPARRRYVTSRPASWPTFSNAAIARSRCSAPARLTSARGPAPSPSGTTG